MRFLLQTLGLLIVLWLGWDQPYRDVVARVCPWADIAPSRLSMIKARATAPRAPSSDGAVPGSPDGPPAPRRQFESTSSLNKPAKH